MKYKFPKKINIGAHEFHIKYDKKSGGGSFEYPYNGKKAQIVIGTRDMKGDSGDFLAIVIHEVTEILMIENCSRFVYIGTNNSYLFSYRHEQHTTICCALAGILKEFIQ
jgi:hypothetical protein